MAARREREYSALVGLDEDQPIQKMALRIHHGIGGLLMVDPVLDRDGTAPAGGGERVWRGGVNVAIHEIGQALMV